MTKNRTPALTVRSLRMALHKQYHWTSPVVEEILLVLGYKKRDRDGRTDVTPGLPPGEFQLLGDMTLEQAVQRGGKLADAVNCGMLLVNGLED